MRMADETSPDATAADLKSEHSPSDRESTAEQTPVTEPTPTTKPIKSTKKTPDVNAQAKAQRNTLQQRMTKNATAAMSGVWDAVGNRYKPRGGKPAKDDDEWKELMAQQEKLMDLIDEGKATKPKSQAEYGIIMKIREEFPKIAAKVSAPKVHVGELVKMAALASGSRRESLTMSPAAAHKTGTALTAASPPRSERAESAGMDSTASKNGTPQKLGTLPKPMASSAAKQETPQPDILQEDTVDTAKEDTLQKPSADQKPDTVADTPQKPDSPQMPNAAQESTTPRKQDPPQEKSTNTTAIPSAGLLTSAGAGEKRQAPTLVLVEHKPVNSNKHDEKPEAEAGRSPTAHNPNDERAERAAKRQRIGKDDSAAASHEAAVSDNEEDLDLQLQEIQLKAELQKIQVRRKMVALKKKRAI